jgi:hypothetical protein
MLATVERALAELEEEPIAPEGETSLKLLQAIYRDKKQPLNVRVRCAIESLPFETPKLSATAVATMDGQSFAEALERAINRSQSPIPLLNGPVEQLPAEELKKPMPRYRNNFRRY